MILNPCIKWKCFCSRKKQEIISDNSTAAPLTSVPDEDEPLHPTDGLFTATLKSIVINIINPHRASDSGVPM